MMTDPKEVLELCERTTGQYDLTEVAKMLIEEGNWADSCRAALIPFMECAETALPELAQRVLKLEGEVDPYWMNKAQEIEDENAKLRATIAAMQDALEEIKARCEIRRQDDDAHYENYYEAKRALAAAGYGGEE